MKKILSFLLVVFLLGSEVSAETIRKMGTTNAASEILENGK